MSGRGPDFPEDKTAPDRRKDLSEQEIKDLKLAGGVEGGMQAGSGGPELDSNADGPSDKESSEGARSRQD